MKSLSLNLILLVLFAFAVSCQDDESQGAFPPDHVEVNNVVIENIPSFLKATGTNVIYKEELSGREWELTIGYNNDIAHANISNSEYTYDQIQINAVDLRNNNTIISTVGNSQLDQNLNVVNSITSVLRYNGATAFTSTSFYIDANGEKTPGFVSAFAGDITLGGKVFNDVFKIKDDDNFSRDDDSLLYINTEFGVVGFTGPTGELWVFDRVQE